MIYSLKDLNPNIQTQKGSLRHSKRTQELDDITFAAFKTQICQPEVIIIGEMCNTKGQSPDTARVDKILRWPPLTNQKEVHYFLGLCKTI